MPPRSTPIERVYRIYNFVAFKKEMMELLGLDAEAALHMWNVSDKIMFNDEVCVQWIVRETHYECEEVVEYLG